tara:strand:+ start:38 stop:712 length:675 start_codon:yes stop_codon:yes gene_type:complete
MKYIINNIGFKTQKSVQEYAKKILYKNSLDTSLEHDDLMFMLDYFKTFHCEWSQKLGEGIKDIKRTKEVMFGKHRAFWIYREDGTDTDISYVISRIKKRIILREFKEACRELIRPQINEFRKNAFFGKNEIECPLSGEMVTRINCHIDHSSPTFEEIIQMYLKEYPVKKMDKVISTPKDNQLTPVLIEKDISDKFYLFHKKVANLRVLSAHANLSLAKRHRLHL